MRLARFALSTAVVAALLQVAPVAAEPLTYPNGPWVQPNQEVSLSAIRTYDELMLTLENIVVSSQGTVALAPLNFPAKGSGRFAPYVKIGHGPKTMIVIAQQHGNEFITSNGMISLIRTLATNSKEAKAIREKVTLYVVPRVNIDGFDFTPTGVPWRYNVFPAVCDGLPNCPPYSQKNQGYDINRYHSCWDDYPYSNPNVVDPNYTPAKLAYRYPVPGTDNPVPESKNVRWLYDLAGGPGKVDVVIDLHGQSTPILANGDMVTVSSLWPTATLTAESLGVGKRFEDAQQLSKQVIAVAMQAWSAAAHATPSLYDGGDEPGIARNAYGILGSASVLMEHRGVGQKAAGYMANISYNAVLAVVKALADGSLYNADPKKADTLQPDVGGASLLWKCMASRPYTLEDYNWCRAKLGMTPATKLPYPTFPFDGAPGPGEAMSPDAAAQFVYELTSE